MDFFFFFLIVWLVPFGLELLAIIMHFSSCKSINTKAIIPPPSLNSLNCLQFMSRKRIDFPPCPPHRVKGRCLYSVLGTRWGSCACQRLCSLTASHSQCACLLLKGPHRFPSLLQLGTPGLYYPCLMVFLKLQYYALGQRLFHRHPWSACSFLSHSLVCLVSPCLQQCAVPLGMWSPAAFYPARRPLFTVSSDRLRPVFP